MQRECGILGLCVSNNVFVSDAKFTKKEQEYISDNFGSYYKLDQLNKILQALNSYKNN